MTDGINDRDVAILESALENCRDSPGCFGTWEFMSRGLKHTDEEFHVTVINETVIPIKTSIYKKWGILTRTIATSTPINGLLGDPFLENGQPILGFLDTLSAQGEVSLHLSESWNELLGPILSSIGFVLREKTRAHRIDLPDTYENWFKMKGVQRDTIRKSERSHLSAKRSGIEGLEDFYHLYKLSNKRWRQKGKTTQGVPVERFARFFELAKERYSIYFAHSSEQRSPIAAAMVGVMGKIATYVYGATDVAFGHLRPANYLHASIIKNLIEKGVHTYVMGMSNNDRNVERFKEHLGAYSYPVFVYGNGKRRNR